MAKNVKTISITVEGEKWQNALDNTFKKKRKSVNVDGFRKGSVPKDIYIKKFGIESLYMDSVNDMLDSVYQDALKESDITPVIEPSVDIKEIDDKHVVFEITITGKPEVKLGEYKNLKIKKEKVNVTDKEIADEIEYLRSEFAEVKIKDKDSSIEKGDTAIIDFKGYVNNEELDGGNGTNYPLEIGSNTFIPGFEEALIGMKVDENKTLHLKFPDNYVKDLANKDVDFDVTIREIKTRVLPEIDKDFFEDLGYDKVTNKEELESEVKKVIEKRKETEIDNDYINNILEAASNNMKVELSDEIIHDEIHHMIHQFEEQLKMQGINLKQYCEFTHKTEEDLENDMKSEATKRIKYRYLLEEVCQAEMIDVTDEEALKDAEEMAKNYGITKDELINAFGNMEVLKYDAKMRKTLEFLKDNN